jgi:DNA transposition AAA+ family ATPase
MGGHYLDLADARTLPTPGLVATHRAVADLLEYTAMGVVHGMAGLGKTYGVQQALARAGEHSACWATFPSRPTMRLVAARLFEQLTYGSAGRRSRFELMDQLVEELVVRPRAIVIDEAQRLTSECIEFLRYLHDHPHTRFGLILVGGDGCWEVLSREPMLRSRIFRRVNITPLTGGQVCELMGGFHPIYAGVEREVLLLVDDHFAHGNLRDWVSFTHSAAKLCAEHGRERLDAEIARNTFALHGGGVGV